MIKDKLKASYIRRLYGPTLHHVEDYTEKEVNSMLTYLLGKPGVSAGKGQLQGMSSSSGSFGSSGMVGESTSAYNAAQGDSYQPSGGATAAAAGIGIIRDLIGYYHADKSAQIAYERQNEYTENYLTMPAKVQQYQDAGLNPMGLAGAGVGATSAPSVQQSQTPSGSGITDVLGALLQYKADMKRIDVESRRVDLEQEKLPAMIEQALANAANKRKQNEWYDAAIGKMSSEVDLIQAHVTKVFADTDKVNAETFLLEVQGKYADAAQRAQLANMIKDLGLKDSMITKNDAEAALAWANKNLTDITSQYQGALMQANTEASKSRAAVNFAEEAVKTFEVDYKRTHNGAIPPSGTVATVMALCQGAANRIVGVAPDPNYGLSK